MPPPSHPLVSSTDVAPVPSEGLRDRLADIIMELVAAVPKTQQSVSHTPLTAARALARSASRKAAALSAGAAMAPGPLGMLTLVPELLAVWRVQAQMVSDIAGAFGKTATLNREQMMYCLFRHLLVQGLRDVVVRTGERYLVRSATARGLQKLASLLGLNISQRLTGKGLARYVPGAGAMLVAGYAYYDTAKVAATAIELFGAEIVLSGDADIIDV